jgi:hypothetical protein
MLHGKLSFDFSILFILCNDLYFHETVKSDLWLWIDQVLHRSRGLLEKDFEDIAVFIDRALKITADVKKAHPEHKLKDFKDLLLQVRSAMTNGNYPHSFALCPENMYMCLQKLLILYSVATIDLVVCISSSGKRGSTLAASRTNHGIVNKFRF